MGHRRGTTAEPPPPPRYSINQSLSYGLGKTQDHRSRIEQWLAVGGWRLAVGGGWWLVGLQGLEVGRQLLADTNRLGGG